MSTSIESWGRVWKNPDSHGEYGYSAARLERAYDKLAHFRSIGVKFRQNEKILEAGCGDGAVIITLQKKFGVDGYGADFAEAAQKQAQVLMKKEACVFRFTLTDICGMPFPDSYFDGVICLGVVEHMSDPMIPIRELYRVLKPGGTAVIMTPNYFSFGRFDRILKQLFGRWEMGPQDEYSPRSLARFLQRAGFVSMNKAVILRPPLANDRWSRRVVSYLDKATNYFVKGWGFYSYTWATKD